MPISNVCVSTNMKYKGEGGLGRSSRIKQQERTMGRDWNSGILDFFLLFCVTFLFFCFGFISLIPKIDEHIISHNIVI